MEERCHRGGVGGDTGDVRSCRERSDLEGSVGEADQRCLQLIEIDVAVRILRNDHHIRNRLSPRKLVAVVLERADEHDGSFGRRDLFRKAIAIIEPLWDADAKHPDNEVDGTGRPTAAEQHRMLVGGTDALADDAASVLSEPSCLKSGS